MTIPNYWSSFVFSYRRLHGLTQGQLAEHLAVSQQTVSRWEAGQQTPDARSQAALKQVLGEADLSSEKIWRERINRSSGYEALINADLEIVAISLELAKAFQLAQEDIVGRSIAFFLPSPRPKHMEAMVAQGFFRGLIRRGLFRTEYHFGTYSLGFENHHTPILTSDSGILLHTQMYPFDVRTQAGLEGSNVTSVEIEPNTLLAAT